MTPMTMDQARWALRTLSLTSVPGETHQALIQRQVRGYIVAGEINKTHFAYIIEKQTVDVARYLEGSRRNRPIAAALAELGMAACSCGRVECEGCEAGHDL